MISNPIVDAMLNRKSIRKYKEEQPSDDVVQTIVRAGQQAPFASQLYSLLLSRKGNGHPFKAPLLFTICVDLHKMATIMEFRNWRIVSNDLSLVLFGIQDAAYAAENMVMAAESLGLGSCFLGGTPYSAATIREDYKLPQRVFPFVQLAMGYPAEGPPPRPRYPMDFVCFEDEYPEFTREQIERAAHEMDSGYMAQDYYQKTGHMIPLEVDREETFTLDTYGWTEHISRKWGQWLTSQDELLEQFEACGFRIGPDGTAGSTTHDDE